MEQEFDLRMYIGVLRRRYLYLILPILPLFALACTIIYLIPPVYHASAKILVQAQQIPQDLARPTVNTDPSQQIEVIRQRLMTRSNLLEIVRKFDLYPTQRAKQPLSEVVETMREATVIEQIAVGGATRRRQQAIAFSVSFDYGDPKKASSVANEFVSLILEQNIKSRTSRAAETYKFFVQQVTKLSKELAAQEARIVEFKLKHEATLPESLGYRRVLHTRLQSEKSEIDREIGTFRAEKDRLQGASESGTTTEELNATEAELARVRLQLTQLRAVYSDRHPSVRKAVRRIEALEKVSAAEAKKSNSDEAKQAGAKPQTSPRVTAQVTAIDRKIADLNARRKDVEEKITEVEESILRTPQVEVALRNLTRRYEQLQTQQTNAHTKAAEAETGELLEENRQAERFEVIERATKPSRPAKPKRPQLMAAGLFVSIAASIGLVLLVELLDGGIHRGADLEKRLKIRPLATIPLVVTTEERQAQSRRRAMVISSAIVLALIALAAVHLFYQPLDVMVHQLLRRVGI